MYPVTSQNRNKHGLYPTYTFQQIIFWQQILFELIQRNDIIYKSLIIQLLVVGDTGIFLN